jgi:hypothetical protein
LTRLIVRLEVFGGQKLTLSVYSEFTLDCFVLCKQEFNRLKSAKQSYCGLEILEISRFKASLIKNYGFLSIHHHYCYFIRVRIELKRSSYLSWEV